MGNSIKKILREETPLKYLQLPTAVMALISIFLNSIIIWIFWKTKKGGNGARFSILAGKLITLSAVKHRQVDHIEYREMFKNGIQIKVNKRIRARVEKKNSLSSSWVAACIECLFVSLLVLRSSQKQIFPSHLLKPCLLLRMWVTPFCCVLYWVRARGRVRDEIGIGLGLELS